MTIKDDVFKGKTVLVTGHTGFKGAWLSIWLKELGANVIGYALGPHTQEDIFVTAGLRDKIASSVIGDVRGIGTLHRIFESSSPEIVFHLAAQPIVRTSYAEPKLTYDTNIMGTVNVLECCRLSNSVKAVVVVTSDKCYENREWDWGYRENDALGGHDPYSSSKACAEIITAAYRDSFLRQQGKRIATARAGNVIGGGDWQTDRLVPDCIRALKKHEAIKVRNPQSVRPWQFVLEPLAGYLMLVEKLMGEDGEKYEGAWNFAPSADNTLTVKDIVESVIENWGEGRYTVGYDYTPEAKMLMLDASKARRLLHWKPKLPISDAIRYTVDWYRNDKPDYDFCVRQLFLCEAAQRLCCEAVIGKGEGKK